MQFSSFDVHYFLSLSLCHSVLGAIAQQIYVDCVLMQCGIMLNRISFPPFSIRVVLLVGRF